MIEISRNIIYPDLSASTLKEAEDKQRCISIQIDSIRQSIKQLVTCNSYILSTIGDITTINEYVDKKLHLLTELYSQYLAWEDIIRNWEYKS